MSEIPPQRIGCNLIGGLAVRLRDSARRDQQIVRDVEAFRCMAPASKSVPYPQWLRA